LPRSLRANAQIHHTHLTRVAAKLSPRLLRQRLTRGNEIISSLGERSKRARRTYLDQRAQRLRSAWQLLNAYSYRKVLERGFTLVRDGEGRPLRSATAVGAGMRLDIEFSDGRVGATSDSERAAPPSEKIKPRTRGSGEGSGGQGSLFGS
jgi:exodeoxyribonuclease VII large subunit